MQAFLDKVAQVNSSINGVVWGLPMLILLIGTGIYLTVRTHFFQVIYAHVTNSTTFLAIFKKKSVTKTDDKKAISQFQALSTALAATIGVGNIAGVATAIVNGGPGAVFWMWFAAFFGMMTNYSENVLGIYYRKKNAKGEWTGGAMYYIQEGFKTKGFLKKVGKPLAIIFSIFCVLASFGIGNMSQVNTIASSLKTSFQVPEIATGIVLAALVALVILGGIKRIASVTEKVVPFMAVVYIIASIAVLVVNYQKIPEVFGGIFKAAFTTNAVLGGVTGFAVKEAVTWGFKRGVFSNEAGLGSSVMVHSASDVKEPVVQGMWGIFEVFFDTIIVCSLTAFTLLSSGVVGSVDATGAVIKGAPLVSLAFNSTFHELAGVILSIAIVLFAFSTVLGWSYYGTQAIEYLAGKKAGVVYKVLFVLMVIAGATMGLDLVWDISDTFNGLMAIPNLIGVLVLSGTVIAITRNYIARKIKKTDVNAEPLLSAYPEIQQVQAQALKKEDALEQ